MIRRVIKTWIARDKDNDLGLYLLSPVSNGDCWSRVHYIIPLNDNLFQEVQWSTGPIEVELVIKNNI